MFDTLLPAGVTLSVLGEPLTDPASVAEAGLVSGMATARLRDFATGRRCAHNALRLHGVDAPWVGRQPGGAPMWPAGFVGSITHCDGVYAAAVARAREYRALGIDAEPIRDIPDDLADFLERDDEREQRRDGSDPHIALLRFSAKESVFKAWSPLTGTWLDFADVSVKFAEDGAFVAQVHHPLALTHRLRFMSGRWGIADGTAYTAIAVPQC
ncbi:4'-phosphopantetheinyl transferase family protein [Microbacterium marinilacus]|uniref:4'-phosphopantetheinyl transferase superfamily protein n=1 Tax=Microbacterium marinilacus TaxID=415209 RepID=A0ABP7BNT9_9MICO|nr:4'-phosphopantetheinyl transferase superfamily protein [Microbacterium marinilacus]MBY0690362.1 4'-phosphopantetheinyl transferase superfamily protein [Microbacterium marinilacus]